MFLEQAASLTPHAHHLHIHDNFGLMDITPVYTKSEAVAFGEGDLHLPFIGGYPMGWPDHPVVS